MPFDFSSFRHSETSSYRLLYGAGISASQPGPTFTLSGQIYAAPFMTGRGGLLAAAVIRVNNHLAGSFARGAIYRNTSDGNVYPGALALDVGCWATHSSGVYTNSISFVTASADLYWLASWASGAGGRGFNDSVTWSVFGAEVNLIAGFSPRGTVVTVPYTGTIDTLWPATFPTSGADIGGSALPVWFVVYTGSV